MKYAVRITQSYTWEEEVEATEKDEALGIAMRLTEQGVFTPEGAKAHKHSIGVDVVAPTT